MIQSSLEQGMNFFDTAPLYGSGLAEGYLGLFLYRYAERHQVSREFARQLHFSAEPVLEEVTTELSVAGLLHQSSGHYTLPNSAEIRQGLEHPVRVYEDPLARQDLLAHLYRRRGVVLQ
jgi:hypothetical protein